MKAPFVVNVERRIAAPPEVVFDAWTTSSLASRFLFRTAEGDLITCEIDAVAGGRGFIVERRSQGVAEHHLRYEVVDRPHRLVFLFRAMMAGDAADESEWSRVTLLFEPEGGGTRLALTHEMAPKWAAYEEQTATGWKTILGSLANHMDFSK